GKEMKKEFRSGAFIPCRFHLASKRIPTLFQLLKQALTCAYSTLPSTSGLDCFI
ncbi:hypothetical protein STEG23_003788, partial [Scotinomys teguina]